MLKDLWWFLGTEQGLLIGGFFLTTIAGALIAAFVSDAAWKRDARVKLFGERYRDGTAFLASLSTLIDCRLFTLQRFIWEIEEGTAEMPEKLDAREREYFAEVVKWNSTLRSTHNNLRLLVGEEEAIAFLDYSDDLRPDSPQSLHYKFRAAHRAVMLAKNDKSALSDAKQKVERLNWAVSRFISEITTTFAVRSQRLQLLQITPAAADDAHLYPDGA